MARMPSRRVRSCGSSIAITTAPGFRSTGAAMFFFQISEATRSLSSAGMTRSPSQMKNGAE